MGVEFDNVKFHKCVDLNKFNKNNKIIFIPPDGEFELMNYTIKTKFDPLFILTIDTVKSNKSYGEFVLTLGSRYKSKTIANDVVIIVPLPCDAVDVKMESRDGYVEYSSEKDSIKWNIKHLKGEELMILKYKYKLPSLISPDRNKYKSIPI